MLEKWIEAQRLKNNAAGVEIGSTLLRLYGDEPFPSAATPITPEARILQPGELVSAQESKDALDRAISEYKEGSLTPELVNTTWQTIWKAWGESINHTFQVPSCDRTSEDLAELQKEGKAVLLLPDEIYTKEGLVLLGRMFPKMQNWSVEEGTTVTNDHDKGGAIDIEMDVDSPNRSTNETQAMDILKKEGRGGQRLATFIIGAQFSNLLTGRYLDEGSTWSRLLGSRSGGYVVGAYFNAGGRLHGYWYLDPRRPRGPSVGGRSEGVKKA